jgi:hypothetical protein
LSLRQRYVDLLARFVPASAVGITLLLGSAMPSQANEQPLANQPAAANERVSERLAAIREAVSVVLPGEPQAQEGKRLAWHNGWHNWHNWHKHWHNWHNWHNHWHNHWHNW